MWMLLCFLKKSRLRKGLAADIEAVGLFCVRLLVPLQRLSAIKGFVANVPLVRLPSKCAPACAYSKTQRERRTCRKRCISETSRKCEAAHDSSDVEPGQRASLQCVSCCASSGCEWLVTHIACVSLLAGVNQVNQVGTLQVASLCE